MLHRIVVAWVSGACLGALGVGCGSAPATPPEPGEIALTPHREDSRVSPVGTGSARCEVYLYAWAGEGCRFQLNHCAIEHEGSDSVVCLSLADERSLGCGATADACGQTVRCACPEGPAPVEPEDPATWHVRPTERGARTASADGRCTATVTEIPGGPPPAPCIFDVHECDASGACLDRQHMASCGVRTTLCDRPLRCDCEGPVGPESEEPLGGAP